MDHRIELYPHRAIADKDLGHCAGVPYVDIDAVRHLPQGPLGLPALLQQAWERYRLPLAITECHNGATRDEQVRWFVEVWESARALRAGGMDLRAVTAWALLGSYDWNRMVTRFWGHYEPGVFDVRSGEPRPTLMARVMQQLARGEAVQAPCLAAPGWWKRNSRMGRSASAHYELQAGAWRQSGIAPLLIVGDDGPLTHLAMRACETRALHYVRSGADLQQSIAAARPWAVLDTRDREGLAGPRRRHDPHGPRSSVARLCADAGVPCALFTSAFGPGLAAEALALPGVLVARTGPVFVPWDVTAAPCRWLDALDAGGSVRVDAHARWHGVYGPDLMDGVLDLLLDGCSGAMNFVPTDTGSAAALARHLAGMLECGPERIELHGEPPAAEADLHRGVSCLPPTETTLERFVRERRLARLQGEMGVQRRADEVRMEEVELEDAG